ncbi:hypothetical protein GGR54DRAFT_591907 [Hypoxylon sp. NC1633]|nr:hypothetical protein GGR54DRAFT_591907 [Hypoxylon sp. NC1633]
MSPIFMFPRAIYLFSVPSPVCASSPVPSRYDSKDTYICPAIQIVSAPCLLVYLHITYAYLSIRPGNLRTCSEPYSGDPWRRGMANVCRYSYPRLLLNAFTPFFPRT